MSKVKIVDKRMFTPEGELREEYSFLEERATPKAEESEESERPAAEAADGEAPAELAERAAAEPPETEDASTGRPPVDLPEMPGVGPQPGFVDLLSLVAEPAAVYLGDARLPDGRSAEDLDMARLHIDLLDVLRKKTAGNLTAQESTVLEDLLYRLRMRYVEKRG